MVLIRVQSAVPSFSNASISVGVKIEGERINCPEFPFLNSLEATYIESLINKKWILTLDAYNPNSVDPKNTYEQGAIHFDCELFVDGLLARHVYIGNGRHQVNGRRAGDSESRFVFAEPKIQTTCSKSEIAAANSKIGTIEVKFWLARMHCDIFIPYYDVLSKADAPTIIESKHLSAENVSVATKFEEPVKNT
ncbi:hypothetical protein HK100_009275 [Physocladia obscura]|uniref:Uncharacterized protein n=1 Tax=Physocladia obscura TaxID=109957 RepID=A0AAD5XJD1_9FUNG|nr:hypothetical protein HK100_009275 [Physocladia obscura]